MVGYQRRRNLHSAFHFHSLGSSLSPRDAGGAPGPTACTSNSSPRASAQPQCPPDAACSVSLQGSQMPRTQTKCKSFRPDPDLFEKVRFKCKGKNNLKSTVTLTEKQTGFVRCVSQVSISPSRGRLGNQHKQASPQVKLLCGNLQHHQTMVACASPPSVL